jgi:hypothetical protein
MDGITFLAHKVTNFVDEQPAGYKYIEGVMADQAAARHRRPPTPAACRVGTDPIRFIRVRSSGTSSAW